MIKCFRFASTVVCGIPVKDGHVLVGESGRGRSLVRVPVPAGAILSDDGASLLEVPGESGAVVLISDQSGYRGGWSLREARTPDEWRDVVRRLVAHRPPDGMGALNQVNGHQEVGVQACPACDAIAPRPVYRSVDDARIKVLAQGRCAQGAAGNMGGGPEYLLRMSEGYAVECVRSGRLYGSPATYRLECVGGVIVATDPLAVATSALAAESW
jgi:hypothetical protein